MVDLRWACWLVVAHVDHGIRSDSADDARFVEGLARQYGLPFVSMSLSLGEQASEEQARIGRYDFLLEQAEKFGAMIVTAHHADDMVETIALNLAREQHETWAIDEINAHWGARTIHVADTTGTGVYVKTKIPFGSTRYL